jgi:DNA-binding CsgD family transcriptional regulator/PAS domain-containing protein
MGRRVRQRLDVGVLKLDEDAFLDLLYAAAAEPALWETVLERFADLIGGTSVWLSRLNVVDGTGSGVIARIDPRMPNLYLEHYAACNPLNNVKNPDDYWRGWKLRILTDEDWMPKEDLVRSEYYNDFLRPQDIHTTLMVRLAQHRPETSVINVNRSLERGPYERSDVECVERLHPHLIRAFRLSQQFADLHGLSADMAAALDEAPYGIFLLEDTGRVRHANRAAEGMAGPSAALCVVDGGLSATNPEFARRLAGLIAIAGSADPSARRAGELSLPSAGGGAPLTVTVAPQRSGPLAVFQKRPCVVVCVHDPNSHSAVVADTLRDRYGFTPAETRVALAIGDGVSPRRAAETLGVSFHTLRHQLQSVFEKAGINRQAELVLLTRRIADAAAPDLRNQQL